MHPTSSPMVYMFQFFCVAGAVLATLFVTENPLALLGLFFMPNIPLVPDAEEYERLLAQGEQLEGADSAYQDTRSGFTSKPPIK